ncbi:MAG: hypothetical protein ACI9K5_003774, partial [Gammaproteobacteria bacterium]
MGCQAGVKATNLTTVMTEDKTKTPNPTTRSSS